MGNRTKHTFSDPAGHFYQFCTCTAWYNKQQSQQLGGCHLPEHNLGLKHGPKAKPHNLPTCPPIPNVHLKSSRWRREQQTNLNHIWTSVGIQGILKLALLAVASFYYFETHFILKRQAVRHADGYRCSFHSIYFRNISPSTAKQC